MAKLKFVLLEAEINSENGSEIWKTISRMIDGVLTQDWNPQKDPISPLKPSRPEPPPARDVITKLPPQGSVTKGNAFPCTYGDCSFAPFPTEKGLKGHLKRIHLQED